MTKRRRSRRDKQTNTPTPPRNRLLTLPEVAQLGGASESTVRRMVKRGTMPPPVDLGMPQLQRWHPLRVREAWGIADLPESTDLPEDPEDDS